MKLYISILFFVYAVNLSIAQEQLIQNSEGAISLLHVEDGEEKSFVLVNSKSFSLLDFKIEGNQVLYFLVNREYISWMRCQIDRSKQSSILIDSQDITRRDQALRSELAVNIKSINEFSLVDKVSQKPLIEIKYDDMAKSYSLYKDYDNSMSSLAAKDIPPIQVVNGKR